MFTLPSYTNISHTRNKNVLRCKTKATRYLFIFNTCSVLFYLNANEFECHLFLKLFKFKALQLICEEKSFTDLNSFSDIANL